MILQNKFNVFIALMITVNTAMASTKITTIVNSPYTLILEVSEQYYLGDSDTLIDAKNINIEQAKKSASDFSGTYVEKELVVNNSKITKQEIRVLTAGFVEVISRSDKRGLNKSGELYLLTKAKIKLSKKLIKDGLNKLKTDPEKLNKISDLKNDNDRLRKQLYDLTKSINRSPYRDDLAVKRNEVLESLERNRTAVKMTFKDGGLLQMASLDKDEYEMAKADIDSNVFGYILNETKITLGEPNFILRDDGKYDAHVSVAWEFSGSAVAHALLLYFDMDTDNYGRKKTLGDSGVDHSFSIYKKGQKKHYYSDRLVNYLFDHAVLIEVSMGNHKGYVPIARPDGFMRPNHYVVKSACLNEGCRPINAYDANPIILEKLTKNQLKEMTTIESKIVILNKRFIEKNKIKISGLL